ncbi:hypothetical protein H1R20_g10211, partial [Candolleomyces eurysporus]
MKPEARNALPERWLPKLCSQLSRARSVEAVQAILDGLDRSLSDNQVEGVLRQLLDATEHKQLLELVLAYGSWSQRLSAWLLKGFPKHPVDEFHTSIHSEILERLSHFLLSLPCAFERETQLFLSEARFQAERIPGILKYMVNFARGNTRVIVDVNEADSRGSVTGKKQKRAHRKQAHKMEKQNSGLKQQDLARLNVTDPRTREEASSNANSLLNTLRETLSYQIDCIPEYDSNFERQVIKIFGIYTSAQIDKRFWDSVGYQLSKKGKTYHDRCTFRNRPVHKGDNVILPATFPPGEREVSDYDIIPEPPKDDPKEAHSPPVLDEFVTLSTELLKGILANLDTPHVYTPHVFNVTPNEKEIIEHQGSCYVISQDLCHLLEGDIENTVDDAQLITYNAFLEQYWPHFSRDLTKNLDPALVFSEILGVIEGSEESLSNETQYLDLTAYRNLSHRAHPFFAKQRDRIYLIFQAYMKRKKQRGEFDTADRTHHLLKALDATGVPGTKIDYLYVDEVQDNLLIDSMFLRSLCRNPNGLFWAANTAPTMGIGNSFRLNDLKAFLYRLEQRREEGGSGVTQSELRTFQLTVNYCTHGGIIRCATAVVELIKHFWPYAIDSFGPEKGIVNGAKPVFISGWDTNKFQYEHFLSRGFHGNNKQQVLLYKFFEDSNVNLGQWRVILNLVKTPTGCSVHVPPFNEERHAGVCSELKALYVAITRSRKNLWILDNSEKAEPMKILWDSKGYIQCRDVPQPQLAKQEEWAATGRTLFTNRRYLQAKHAFERAGKARDAKISYTYHLRDNARSIHLFSKEAMPAKRNAFYSAAESFLECAGDAKGKEQRVLFHNAAECFENAGSCGDNMGDYRRAAEVYENAKEYTPAVRLYMKTDVFDEAVRVLQEHRHEVDKELANNVQEVARLHYFKNKEFRKAETLFESVEEQLEYWKDAHLDETVQPCSIEEPNSEKAPPENTRRVFFKNLDDVSGSAHAANTESGSNSTVKAQGNTPAGPEQPVQRIGHPEPVLTNLAQEDVALRLLYKFRQRVKNKELEKHKTTMQKTYDSYFETCLKLASDPKGMQWSCGSYYRKLYLGLVPHLLACAREVESYALSAWSEARNQCRKEKQDYDGMYKTKSEIIAILKESRKLGSRLDPSSEVHKKRDIEGLEQLAREVEQLVKSVPSGAGLDIHFSLQLAMKGIISAEPKRG